MDAKAPTPHHPPLTEAEEQQQQQDAQVPVQDGQSESETSDTPRVHRSLSAIHIQYGSQTDIPRRIHILGAGSIGKLVAHSLRGIANPPPITLVLHRYQLLQAWEKGSKEITIQDGEFKVSRGGFDVELMPEVRRQHGVDIEQGKPSVYDVAGENMRPHEVARLFGQGEKAAPQHATVDPEQSPPTGEDGDAQPQQAEPSHKAYYKSGAEGDYAYSTEPIHNLIVTTKAPYTVPALLRLRPRISRATTICFLQNGMGIIDDVNKQLFPHEAHRPSYVQGILTHGVNVPPETAERDPFFAVHAGHGTIALGVLPRSKLSPADPADSPQSAASDDEASKREIWAPSARYLLRTLTRTPALCAVGFTPTELLQQQLEKLAVNSVLNPLTSLLDARNGALLHNFALTRTLRLLLAETSLVIRSLPELASIPNIHARFSAQRLEQLVVSVADKTQGNVSSMLADVRAGRRTEIEWINGYIVRRGEEVGVSCVVNYAVMQMVVGKAMVTQREAREDVPVVRGR